ncbi:winged helix-turn-helix domain-containing protein [Actinophytocola sp. KF-1]
MLAEGIVVNTRGGDVPTLRIHFTEGDLGRTRLSLATHLMWELVSSVQILQHGDGELYFDDWRRRVRERVAHSVSLRAAVRLLATVAPHASYFPDFLTPEADVPDFDTGIDVVLSTSSHRLRTEVGRLQDAAGASAWLDDLGHGRGTALGQLRTALRTYAVEIIQPHRRVIDDALQAERADRIDVYLDHGPEALLKSFAPTMTWRHPVLTVDYPIDRDLHLNGRGLLLVPCYFCLGQPVALADPDERPVLVFPLKAESRLATDPSHAHHLSALLGSTRADILRSLPTCATTTQLATRNNITPATTSHHTTVLRNAGLITTRRDANRAVHALTPLGRRLLTRTW